MDPKGIEALGIHDFSVVFFFSGYGTPAVAQILLFFIPFSPYSFHVQAESR
jgi:hypothetical protein